MRNLDAQRRLPAFVLAAIDHRHHAHDRLPREPHRHDVFQRAVFLDIGFENRIQDSVWRQTVFIFWSGRNSAVGAAPAHVWE